jgi:predicted TIM-barrel fold metal-dependent hydrolase
MEQFGVVDADSHVMEITETWEYLEEAFVHRRPVIAQLSESLPIVAGMDQLWFIDGRLTPRPMGRGATISGTPTGMSFARKKVFSAASQGLTDIEARLRDMDAWGIEIQVLFSSIFIQDTTEDPSFEAALMRSYNTWMAKRCAERPDRLKWSAAIPLRDIAAAIAEVHRARALGAVGVTIGGTAGTRLLHHRELEPFFAAVSEEDLPLCVHCSWSLPGLTAVAEDLYFTLPILMGFHSLVGCGVLDRFPKLRVGFMEAGSEWIPYWIGRMDHYHAVSRANGWGRYAARRPSEYLKDGRIWVTCEAEESLLNQVIDLIGEDYILFEGDMPHAEARDTGIKTLRERTDLSERVKRKILRENALAFYRLA